MFIRWQNIEAAWLRFVSLKYWMCLCVGEGPEFPHPSLNVLCPSGTEHSWWHLVLNSGKEKCHPPVPQLFHKVTGILVSPSTTQFFPSCYYTGFGFSLTGWRLPNIRHSRQTLDVKLFCLSVPMMVLNSMGSVSSGIGGHFFHKQQNKVLGKLY